MEFTHTHTFVEEKQRLCLPPIAAYFSSYWLQGRK